MITKFNKFFSFLRVIFKQPSLINLVLNNNIVNKEKFLQKYPNIISLPQIDLKDLQKNNSPDKVESFLLDGSSLVLDLQLLITLASRENIKNYIEIGTWRGESVHNVAKYVEDCSTINLSAKEITALGLSEKYAYQHGILSKKNPTIHHIEANTKTFKFESLQKRFDLIFIDGDHTYEMVLNDTKKVFENLVHKNSIVVWHDYAYSPQKLRYEVFMAILDGVGKENQAYLYHPKNTMCAIFTKEKLSSTVFDEMEFPKKIYEIDIKEKTF